MYHVKKGFLELHKTLSIRHLCSTVDLYRLGLIYHVIEVLFAIGYFYGESEFVALNCEIVADFAKYRHFL